MLYIHVFVLYDTILLHQNERGYEMYRDFYQNKKSADLDNESVQTKKVMFLSVLIILLMLIFGYIYLTSLNRLKSDEIEINLYEVAKQKTNVLEKQISGDFQTLKGMAALIGEDSEFLDFESIAQFLKNENRNNDFFKMGIASTDGDVFLDSLDGLEEIHSSESLIAELSLEENRELLFSPQTYDEKRGMYYNYYTVPIYHQEQFLGLLIAAQNTETFYDILDTKVYEKKGYGSLINMDGDFLIATEHENTFETSNLFESALIDDDIKNEIKEKMVNQESFSFKLTFSSEDDYWITCSPIGTQDLYIVSMLPRTVIDNRFDTFITETFFYIATIIIVFIFLIHYILRMHRKNQRRLSSLAYRDDLTHAYNKNKFDILLKDMLDKKECTHALVAMNVAEFKKYNEVFGVAAGDQLLINISNILKEQLSTQEIYARSVSDHFFLLMDYNIHLKGRLQKIIDKICIMELEDKRDYKLAVRCGVYRLKEGDHKIEINLLEDRCEYALAENANVKKNAIVFYNDSLHLERLQYLELEKTMHQSLANDEFVVYLQPQYDTQSKTVIGAEALVRWNHPEQGLLTPNHFISLFEENGFIVNLDDYILECVCKLLRKWLDEGKEVFKISVNQSRLHLYDKDYINKTETILKKYQIPHELIQLEVTETVALHNTEEMTIISEKFNALGLTISMDDFGSGYSSLNVLKDIHVDELKLDRGFFMNIQDNEKARNIISGVLAMAHSLNIKTVAEGIETEEDFEFLRKEHCDIIQGYYFSKPLPIGDFELKVFDKR